MWRRESISDANGSVPANSGAHLVSRGNTAVHRYLLRASAISVALRATCDTNTETDERKYGESMVEKCAFK